jgi:hypothetical protein
MCYVPSIAVFCSETIECIIIIIIIIIHLLQDVYTYVTGTNNVAMVYNITSIMWLQLMLRIAQHGCFL